MIQEGCSNWDLRADWGYFLRERTGMILIGSMFWGVQIVQPADRSDLGILPAALSKRWFRCARSLKSWGGSLFCTAVQGFPGMWCAVLVPLPPTQGRGPSMGQTGLGLYIDHSRPQTCLPFSGSPLPGPQRWLCYVCLLMGEKPVPHTKGRYLKKFSVPTGPHPTFGSSLGTWHWWRSF